MIHSIENRLRTAWTWRVNSSPKWLFRRIARPIMARSGFWSRRIRHPVPWNIPAKQNLLVVSRRSALGDVLMCTPALREVKRLNPNCRIVFHAGCADLVAGLPFIDEVVPHGQAAPTGATALVYDNIFPAGRHLSQIIGDCVGVNVTDIRPSCVFRQELVDQYRDSWAKLPRPWIVVNRKAGSWTPNKDWPDEYWTALVARLATWSSVIEIGACGANTPDGNVAVDLRGRTSLCELAAAIAAADMHVGPDSGPIHIAAAAGKPSVVIFGGYTTPACTSYPGNVNFYTPLACSPCWLRTPCPFAKRCLTEIHWEKVEEAVRNLHASRAMP